MIKKTMTSDQLSDVYTMHMLALAAKSLCELYKKYPDMLPEELLLIAVAGLLCDEQDCPMGSSRQELLDIAVHHMKNVYGNETVLLDVQSWRSIENLSKSLRDLASRGQ